MNYSFIKNIGWAILLIGPTFQLNAQIQGKLNIDESWNQVLYVSHIKNFNDLYSMSGDMIVETTALNKEGEFVIKTDFLPQEDQLYRLHISKKGDPPASLVIGGKDENHLFIIANRNSSFTIVGDTLPGIFQNIQIENSAPNADLLAINEIVAYLDSSDFKSAQVKREFIKEAIYEKLRFIGDTSSHPLTSLYAIYRSKFESNYKKNEDYYLSFLEKWKVEKSSYFQVFREQMPLQPKLNHENWYRAALAFIFLLIGWFAGSKRPKKKQANPLSELSVQERKIFQLLQEGSSNKDISDELSIGLSTVKSHVSSIYTKLAISSRKEVMNIKLPE